MKPSQIDEFVDTWHFSLEERDRALEAAIGFTNEEHQLWLRGNNELADIFAARFLALLTRQQEDIERLTALTAKWAPDGDEPLREDAYIAKAHPLKSGDHTGYMEAMRLVGAKRSKGALVNLVHWLLLRATTAENSVAELREAALEAVICAEANCLTKDAPATARLRAVLQAKPDGKEA
jgi:hypothetical protein